MKKELRNNRINVRATNKMVDRLGAIRCYLGCISDSETLEFVFEYISNCDWKEMKRYYDSNLERK